MKTLMICLSIVTFLTILSHLDLYYEQPRIVDICPSDSRIATDSNTDHHKKPTQRRTPHDGQSIGVVPERKCAVTQGKGGSRNTTHQRTMVQPKICYTTIAKFIEQHEGFRAVPYKCKAGCLTIGYGRVIRQHERNSQGKRPITEECKYKPRTLYETRVSARRALRTRVQADFDAIAKYTSRDTALVLCSFAYNCGRRAALRLVTHHRTRDLGKYCYAKGKKLKGLEQRRKEELALLQLAK
jgi:GH24 family phage-related lysozyme (muramidase)